MEGSVCRRSALPFDAWLYNQTDGYWFETKNTTEVETLSAPRNLQTEQLLFASVCHKGCPRNHTTVDGEAMMLQRARADLRLVDLVGVTEDLGGFLVLLCDLVGLKTCPRYVSANAVVDRTLISSRFPSHVSASAAQHVRTRLAPVDQTIYAEAKQAFDIRKRPFADRIRAYEASAPEPDVAVWHVCSAQSDAFQKGVRVGQEVRKKRAGGVGVEGVGVEDEWFNLVLVPAGVEGTHCTRCNPHRNRSLRTTGECKGYL